MSRQPTELDAALERLYAAPYEAFTDTRDALAKEARAAGNAELAAQLKKERRPPVTAWAVNKLSRKDPAGVRALLESGARLRAAQARAVRGEGADELREATAGQRKLIAGLVKDALALVREAGSAGSADQQDRIEGTLLACANGPEALGEQLRSARLEKDLPRPLFGEAGALDAFAAAPGPREEKPEDDAGAHERERKERERVRHEAEHRAREAGRALAAAQKKRDQALEAARRAEEALAEATGAARRARDALEASEAAAEQAEKDARAADQALAALS